MLSQPPRSHGEGECNGTQSLKKFADLDLTEKLELSLGELIESTSTSKSYVGGDMKKNTNPNRATNEAMVYAWKTMTMNIEKINDDLKKQMDVELDMYMRRSTP